MLRDARKLSGYSWFEVCYKLKKAQSSLIQMLDCKNDYGMRKLLDYLAAIEMDIVLSKDNKAELIINSEPSLHSWIKGLYEGLSGYEIGKRLDISHQTANRIIKGGDVRLSTFLKIADQNDFSITIQPQDIGNIIDASDDCDVDKVYLDSEALLLK